MTYKECPRCHEQTLKDAEGRNALSRRDNKTLICSPCGEEEAFIDAGLMQPNDNEFNFKMAIAAGRI